MLRIDYALVETLKSFSSVDRLLTQNESLLPYCINGSRVVADRNGRLF